MISLKYSKIWYLFKTKALEESQRIRGRKYGLWTCILPVYISSGIVLTDRLLSFSFFQPLFDPNGEL